MTSFKICSGISFSSPLLSWSFISLSFPFFPTSFMGVLLFPSPLPIEASRAILGEPRARGSSLAPRVLQPAPTALHMCLFPAEGCCPGFCFVFCLVRALCSQISTKSLIQDLCSRLLNQNPESG